MKRKIKENMRECKRKELGIDFKIISVALYFLFCFVSCFPISYTTKIIKL